MKNLYIFTGDSYMVRDSLKKLKAALALPYEELNVTEYKTMPKADELIAACAECPFMADRRLLAVCDATVLTPSGSAEEAKKIANYLDRMPESTVLVFCAESADKRRVLYKRIKERGEVREFPAPTPASCAAFVQRQAKAQGARITARVAEQLVSIVGCDYFTLENETAKLVVYSGFGEITSRHIKACASRSLEYNVFEIHRLFVQRQAGAARDLLAQILQNERPEGLVGLFARKLRDMYKTKTMVEAGFSLQRVAQQLKVKNYAAQMLARECARFSAQRLRDGLKKLAEVDCRIKTGEQDAELALSAVLLEIYGF